MIPQMSVHPDIISLCRTFFHQQESNGMYYYLTWNIILPGTRPGTTDGWYMQTLTQYTMKHCTISQYGCVEHTLNTGDLFSNLGDLFSSMEEPASNLFCVLEHAVRNQLNCLMLWKHADTYGGLHQADKQLHFCIVLWSVWWYFHVGATGCLCIVRC